MYNSNTPDLYKNNAHHKIGWIATWIVTAQVIMSLLFHYSGRGKRSEAVSSESRAFMPVSEENMTQHNTRLYSDHRWSADSGEGTEVSSTLNSRDASPMNPDRRDPYDDFEKPGPQPEGEGEDGESLSATMPRNSRLGFNVLDRYLASWAPTILSAKVLRIIEIVYEVIDRTILVLGFIALMTGGVTYVGMFVSALSPCSLLQ